MPRPTKKELAQMKAMTDMGRSPHYIGKSLGHDPKSIRSWLKFTDFNDPELQVMIEKIKSAELDALHLLTFKARAILNNYLDECLEGKRAVSNPIPVVAVMDRSFQQRQILSGGSTANVSIFARTVELACEDNQDTDPGEDKKEK